VTRQRGFGNYRIIKLAVKERSLGKSACGELEVGRVGGAYLYISDYFDPIEAGGGKDRGGARQPFVWLNV